MSTLTPFDGPSTERRRAAALFALALFLRLGVLAVGPWQDPSRALNPDSGRYLNLANNLRTHHTFALAKGTEGLTHRTIEGLRDANRTSARTTDDGLAMESFRTPGYPVLIATLGGSAQQFRSVLLAQCFAGALMAVVLVIVARKLGLNPACARWCGVLWAVHPALVLYDTQVVTESFFNVGVLTALFLSARSSARSTVLLAALVLGCTALVRPVLALFYLPTLLVLTRRDLRASVVGVVAVTSVAVMPLVAWSARNHAVGERFRVSWVGDMNLAMYHLPFALSEERGEDWQVHWQRQVSEVGEQILARLEPGQDVPAAARAFALEQLSVRPIAATMVVIKSAVKIGLDHSLPDVYHALGLAYVPTGLFQRLVLKEETEAGRPPGSRWQPILALMWIGVNAGVGLFAAAGALAAVWTKRWRLVVGAVLPVVLFVAASGAVGLERMRLPIMWPLFVLATSVFDDSRFAKFRRRSSSGAG